VTYRFHIKSGAALQRERDQIALMQRVQAIGAEAVATLDHGEVPFYKKPWFWGVIAGVTVIGGSAIYLARRP